MSDREFLYHKVYSTKRWKKLRLEIYNQSNGICEYCNTFITPIKGKPSYNVHHIVELTKNNYMLEEITYNRANLQLLHQECHNKIHSRFESVSMIKKGIINFEDRDNLLNRSKK